MTTSPTGARAWLPMALALMLNALDGYDILAISFAAPGIARDWQLPPAALGVVLSMELIGVAIGSVVLGRAADRFGRRPVILGCLTVMAIGMAGASASFDVASLCATRVLAGLGIGGMLASLNAIVSETAPPGVKGFAVAVMSSGYSIGGLIGGTVASVLLSDHGWRSAFLVGAIGTLLLLPVIWRLLPESRAFLAVTDHKTPPQPAESGDGLPAAAPAEPGTLWIDRRLLRITSTLTLAYLLHAFTFYFFLKWMPKLVVDLGQSPSAAGGLLVMANAGGIVGALGLGILSLRFRVRNLVLWALVSTFGLMGLLGTAYHWSTLTIAAVAIGLAGNASVTGLYATCAERFPTLFRAQGTGLVIGVGRGGAVLGPVIAGLLIGSGMTFAHVVMLMGIGSIAAAAALLVLPSGADPVLSR